MRYTHNTHMCRDALELCIHVCMYLVTDCRPGPGQAAEWRKLATDMLKEKKRDK